MDKQKFVYDLAEVLKGRVLSAPKKTALDLLGLTEKKGVHCDGILKALDLPQDKEAFYNYALTLSFPESSEFNDRRRAKKYHAALEAYRILTEYELTLPRRNFVHDHKMEFLTEEEISELEDNEYVTFVKSFKDSFIFELMKLSEEVFGYNTLDHVLGVHYIAIFIGRQFKKLGFDIDLGRVSGSAAGHDIGKFGVLKKDGRRVPYLHYYYSDMWFKRQNINYIRNIAVNHSTWDLELENLSLESLILIYSDFRVKNKEGVNPPKMHIYDLKESYEVILNKLDNVDEKKKQRYEKVYRKLKDFEDFMISVGIVTDPESKEVTHFNPIYHDRLSLTFGADLIERLKFFSIDHNTGVMYLLRDENSLSELLEDARGVSEWRDLREYVRLFEEYSTYLTGKQKIQTIEFLKEILVHPEDDIRLNSAMIIGELIASYDEDYRKELPEGAHPADSEITGTALFNSLITELLNPPAQTIDIQKHMLGYSVSVFTRALFENLPQNKPEYIREYTDIFLTHFKKTMDDPGEESLFMLEASRFLPFDARSELIPYLKKCIECDDRYRRLMALEVIYDLDPETVKGTELHKALGTMADNVTVMDLTCTYLIYRMADTYVPDKKAHLLKTINDGSYRIPEVFLSNLKTATHWVLKRNQLKLLVFYTINEETVSSINTAIHFCNIIKVSAYETVRRNAGEALLLLMDHLNKYEKNEVSVELLRALEIEGHKFTEYIPYYLGRVILFTEEKEILEIIDDFREKIKTAKSSVKSLLLKTIGYAISYSAEKSAKGTYKWEHRQKLVNILLSAMADPDKRVRQTAIATIGKTLFGTRILKIREKGDLLGLMIKKILTLATESERNDLNFLSDAAAYNHIYRFISDHERKVGSINMDCRKKPAFFSGTFDPFTLSHREIGKLIRDMGYEVYFSVDEFSWSKKTLPNKVRRSILNMSVAGEENMYLFPESMPVNLGNNEDIRSLKESFDGDITIVCGSDVIVNASAYANEKNIIKELPHIVFLRNEPKENVQIIKERVHDSLLLDLPEKLKRVSSTQIRKNIDENRDISTLIDPLAQEYIYDNGFYQREPINKSLASYNAISPEILTELTPEITHFFKKHGYLEKEVTEVFKNILSKPSAKIMIIRDRKTGEISGVSLCHWTISSDYIRELEDVVCAEKIRILTPGRLGTIDILFTPVEYENADLSQILLTETLANLISRDYEYCLYNPKLNIRNESIIKSLRQFNFTEHNISNKVLYTVNMTTPVALNLDLENVLKEPFKTAPEIRKAYLNARERLQQAIGRMYPGELILSIDPLMLHQMMIDKITRENGVPDTQTVPRKLGAHMCVPYGDILDNSIIPNTVTKALHTEKYFASDLKSFTIKELPFYLSLEDQVRVLKSFDRELILVDTILHKGYRMRALDPILIKEGLKVRKIIAGVLSARGRDLMVSKGYSVDTVYYLPRMKNWFNENTLYPFIGGDSVWRGVFPNRNLLPSINLIMPYTMPGFLSRYDKDAVMNLSKVCLENTLEILTAIEDYYNRYFDRKLTLKNSGQVFTFPRIADLGPGREYDLSESPSLFVRNALETLNRIM